MSSLSEKISSIGVKHDIEEIKLDILKSLTDINLVNFNNVDRYNKNQNNETLAAFIQLVNDNIRYSSLNQVVSNLNANCTRINIVTTAFTSVKDMVALMRDNATKGSDQTLTDSQREEHANRVRLLFYQSLKIQYDCKYNGMHAIDLELTSQLNSSNSQYAVAGNNDVAPYDKLHQVVSGSPWTLPVAGASITDTSTWDEIKLVMTSNICTRSLITGNDHGPVLRRTEDRTIEWKAQIGFDTGSTLTYTIQSWGPIFAEGKMDAYATDDANDFGTNGIVKFGTVGPANANSVYALQVNKSEGLLNFADNLPTNAPTPDKVVSWGHKRAENLIDSLQQEERVVENRVAYLKSMYDYLQRALLNVKGEHKAAMESIESQRSTAKRELETELQNHIRQIEYLNALILFRNN